MMSNNYRNSFKYSTTKTKKEISTKLSEVILSKILNFDINITYAFDFNCVTHLSRK